MVDHASGNSSNEMSETHGHSGEIQIECHECQFGQTLHGTEDKSPAEIIIEHGRESGHVLEIVRIGRGNSTDAGRALGDE
jgi:hypothetical protein